MRIHLMGAGGAGVSALARVFLEVDVDLQIEKEIVAPVIMNTHIGSLSRGECVGKCRQRVEVESDLFSNIFGFGARVRKAHRDRFPDEAHLA